MGEMGAIRARDRRRGRELTEALLTVDGSEASASALIASELLPLLGAEKAVAYGLSCAEERTTVDFIDASIGDEIGDFVRFVEGPTRRVSFFDPRRPEARQRNAVVTMADLGPGIVNAPAFAMLKRYGVERHDQIRVLVCQGPALLAFVGAYREERFGDRERQLLEGLVPAMKRRLALERSLQQSSLDRAALEVLLEAIDCPGFLVTRFGTLRLANAAGRALLEADRRAVEGTLASSVRRDTPGIEVTRVVTRGMPDHFFVFFRTAVVDPQARVLRAAARWRLTRRQTEVLSLLARGYANKTIAASLGCVEGTVELHVTALLRKANCEKRAELIAALWSRLI